MKEQNKEIKSTQYHNKLHSFIDIFIPSLLGLITYIVIYIFALIFSQPSSFKSALSSLNSNNLQGTSIYKYFDYFNKIISSQIVNQIAIYAFWVMVGVIIFVIANRFTKNVNELADDYSLRNYIWPKGKDKNAPLKEFTEKLIFRILIFITIVFYIFKITPILSQRWSKSDLTLGFNFHTIESAILLLIIEFLYLHIFVILVRLFLLRKRIINI